MRKTGKGKAANISDTYRIDKDRLRLCNCEYLMRASNTTLPPISLSLSLSISPCPSFLFRRPLDGGRSAAQRSTARSIYLISSISRLIFSPGLGEMREREAGREGEAGHG